MTLLIRMLVALMAVGFTQLADARSALLEAEIKDIRVTSVAPAVKAQLKKTSPDERKSLEAAIRTGNLFIPQHFSYNAYDTASENQDWFDEVAPLVTLDMEKWANQYGESGISTKDINDVYTYRLTCPQISLISIAQDDQFISLVYRTRSVGTLMYFQSHDLFDFNSDGANEFFDLRLDLEKSSALVSKIIQKDKWQTESFTRWVAYMKRFLGDHGVANISTKEREDEMVRTYQSTIQKIEKSASKYCR